MHKYFLTTYGIGKAREKFIKNYAFFKNATDI